MTDTYLIYILKVKNVDINNKKIQTTSVLTKTLGKQTSHQIVVSRMSMGIDR